MGRLSGDLVRLSGGFVKAVWVCEEDVWMMYGGYWEGLERLPG